MTKKQSSAAKALEKAAMKHYLAGEVDPEILVLPETLRATSTIYKGRRFVILRGGLMRVIAAYEVKSGELRRIHRWPEAIEVATFEAERVRP